MQQRDVLKECTANTAEERADIYRKFYKAKPKGTINALMKTDSSTRPAAVSSIQLSDNNGRLSGLLSDVVTVVVNGDYGAHHAALCERHLQDCAEAGVFVQVLPLGTSITMGLSLSGSDGETGMVFKATKQARISITVIEMRAILVALNTVTLY